jgi:poly-gamma-glutamate synthesis protein (capsule biosynthesis protein)
MTMEKYSAANNLPLTLFLCGDVMPARGIDQILPASCPSSLHEPYVRDAQVYVELAELAHGPIPRSVPYAYIWGHALTVLRERQPTFRIINLESSLTCSEDYCQDKSIHYRTHPKNAALLKTAAIDCCSLANNHSMDWGIAGLVDSLDALDALDIAHVGAGRNLAEAAAPAVLEARGHRVLVYGLATLTSGVPLNWMATLMKPGVHLLEELSRKTARKLARLILNEKKENDLVVISIHWGDNWGYEIPQEQIDFAHELIDCAAVDLVHGHSSHHPKGMEIYRDRLILYGAGDFITDYEGIRGYEEYRGDLTCMYFVSFFCQGGMRVQIVPVRIKNFQVTRPTWDENAWLLKTLQQASARFSLQVKRDEGESFLVEGHSNEADQ